MNLASIETYIRDNWERSIYQDAGGSGFQGVDLPFPYSSPCIKGEGKFYFFFYWDTYFTNLGLLRHGHLETAKYNIENMFWLIRRHGFMPNHVGLDHRSQPPFLCRMVRDYLAASGDEAFFPDAADMLRWEYHFWMNARKSPTGLNRHGHHATREQCAKFYDGALVRRLGMPKEVSIEEKIRIGGHYLAEAETGWDFNPRFDGRCDDFCEVLLNSLLAEYETFLCEADDQLGWGKRAFWESLATTRKERIDQYLWNEERGLFLDYDFVNERPSSVASISTFAPLFAGLASDEQAARVRDNLPLLEYEHGITVTEPCDGCEQYQWAYPNMWPPLTYVALRGLERYGFHDDARRIAEKYVKTNVALFEKTGQLWEKFNAVTGEVAGGEYDAAAMLGWSAGVLLETAALLE